MIHDLMPSLLEVFAEREGLALRSRYQGDDLLIWELSDAETGRLRAEFQGVVQAERAALKELASREVDIALGAAAAAESEIRQDVIALDALLPIVAPENARAMVTQVQLSGLLGGRIGNWSELDGGDLPVELHLSARASGFGPWHGKKITNNVLHERAADVAQAVAANPAALGFVPFSAIGNAVPLVVSGSCGLAIPATIETIRAEDYPLTRPLFLQRIGAQQPKIVREFIAFTRSHEAHSAVRAAGYVDHSIRRIAFDRQGDRIANAVLAAGDDAEAHARVRDMVARLLPMDRLTLTFRFNDGESTLDAQSDSNIRLLADAINRGEFDSETLVFVGFSDGVGPSDGNLRLSKRRAQAVMAAVTARIDGAPVTLDADGFGETLPMSCDDTVWGRKANRRVEVWVE